MADRDLTVIDLIKAFQALKCRADYTASFITVIRPGVGGIKQHVHRGRYDVVRRATVRAMYRKLGFTAEQFYGALGG